MARLIILGFVFLIAFSGCWPLIPPLPENPSGRGTESQNDPSNQDTGAERWECYDYGGRNKLGTLTANRYGTYGTIDFNGIVANTQFSIQGIERRWDWDWGTDGRSNSTIVVSPDGSGRFYNFRASTDGTAKPSELFQCERR